jgi:hypothetical protein
MRSILCSVLLAAAATAQCGTLTATGGAPGSTLDLALHGDANAFAIIAFGQTAGTTTINIGTIATLTLDLAMPFAPVPIGMTNASGDASRSIRIPATLPGQDLLLQGLTASFSFTPPASFGLTFCTSNVVSVHVGS